MRDHFDFSGPDLHAVLRAAARMGNDVGADAAASAVSGLMRAVKLGTYYPQERISDADLASLVGHPHSASVGRSLRCALMDARGEVLGTAGIAARRSRNTRNRRWERERKRRQRSIKVSNIVAAVPPGTGAFPTPGEPLSHPGQKRKRIVIKCLRGKTQMGVPPSSPAVLIPPPPSGLSEAKTRLACDEPASPAPVLAPLARSRRVVVCKRSQPEPRVTAEPVVLASFSQRPSINHAAMKSRKEARDAERKARAAESRAVNAAERQQRAQDRQSFGVTADSVPAAAIDAGAAAEFAEGLERDPAVLKEAKRAYLRYRDLAGASINGIAVPPLRVKFLAEACCRFGFSAGKVLEALHRMHHEHTGNAFAGVTMLAPAALDGACSRATSTGKRSAGAGRGRPSVGYVDKTVALDPRLITALREAGCPPPRLATEEGWARHAVENAKLRASGSLTDLSDAQVRAADVAAGVLGLPRPVATAPAWRDPGKDLAMAGPSEAPARAPRKSAVERQRERDDALLKGES